MKYQRVCVLGGTGFVGSHLAALLCDRGYKVRILTRNRERHRDLLVLPNVQLIEADIYDTAQLRQHLAGCDALVNLVGILNEKGSDGNGFRRAHVELAEKVIKACRDVGIERLLHMSALRADPDRGPSHYLRSKGEAEKRVHAAASDRLCVTSFQPSVIFGPEDSFFNRFAALLRRMPVFFPLASPDSYFAPVYVGDVARAFADSLVRRDSCGQRYALCGPQSYTLKQLVQYTARCLGLYRKVIGLGPTASALQARLLEWVPGKPMSRDNLASLRVDSVCRRNGLEDLGITPTPLDAVVPQYLARRHARDFYDRFRAQARRG